MKAITLERLTKYKLIHGSTLEAVKFWKDSTGMGLRESKKVIDDLKIELKAAGLIGYTKEFPTNKEEYAIMRQEWIKYYNIKEGDTVLVTSNGKEGIGWQGTWVDGMNKTIGSILQIYTVSEDSPNSGIQLTNNWWYPYYVLEKIEPK